MARSYRKNPAGWICSDSMKEWKRKANRKMRHKSKRILGEKGEDVELLPEELIEVSDVWRSPSDGRGWFGDFFHEENLSDWANSYPEKFLRK